MMTTDHTVTICSFFVLLKFKFYLTYLKILFWRNMTCTDKIILVFVVIQVTLVLAKPCEPEYGERLYHSNYDMDGLQKRRWKTHTQFLTSLFSRQGCLTTNIHDNVAGHKIYQPGKGKIPVFLIVEVAGWKGFQSRPSRELGCKYSS